MSQKRYTVSEIGKYAYVVENAMRICGRDGDYFSSYSERNQWIGIAKGMEKNSIPLVWVKHCIKWAMNKNRLKLCIKFPSLTSFILDEIKMQDHMTSLGVKKEGRFKRKEDYDEPINKNVDEDNPDPKKRSW
jgi:hypothetical protein